MKKWFFFCFFFSAVLWLILWVECSTNRLAPDGCSASMYTSVTGLDSRKQQKVFKKIEIFKLACSAKISSI